FEVVDPDEDAVDEDEEAIPEPSMSSFTITGSLTNLHAQRYLKNRLEVRLIDPVNGEIVAAAKVRVANVGFPLHTSTETSPAWTERAHKLKVYEAIAVGQPALPGGIATDPRGGDDDDD